MAASEIEQTAPSTISIMEYTEGMNRDRETEAVLIYEKHQSRYRRAIRPTIRIVESRAQVRA